MHEVRVSAPHGESERVVGMALHVGIAEASVYDVYVHGPDIRRQVVSVETSTPRAKEFVDALFSADWFDPRHYHITTRELRAIFSSERVRDITRPMIEPALDVLEDLWQLNHITPSYVGRAAGAAILLAYALYQNSAIGIVVAALFLPFLSQVLAIGYGLWAGDRALARQGAAALALSTAMSVIGGAVVAWLHGGGSIAFHDFQGPLVAFGISSVIGVAAGLASADDAGRRYLIGVAAAVQYAVFPVWIGTCPDGRLSAARGGRRKDRDILRQYCDNCGWRRRGVRSHRHAKRGGRPLPLENRRRLLGALSLNTRLRKGLLRSAILPSVHSGSF